MLQVVCSGIVLLGLSNYLVLLVRLCDIAYHDWDNDHLNIITFISTCILLCIDDQSEMKSFAFMYKP